MPDSRKTDNEITNLFALVGSIKNNAEKIQGAETQNLINGIKDMCEIASDKLSIVRNEINEVKNV